MATRSEIPSSLHREGRVAREAVETARAQVAALIGAEPTEIDRVKDAEKQRRVEQMLRETPALDFAVYIVSAIAGSQTAQIHALQLATDQAAAKQVVSERVRKEVIDAGVDLFNASPHAGYVLFQIGTWNAESKQMVNEYALKLCKQTPSHIGKLVGGFLVDFGIDFGGGQHWFQPRQPEARLRFTSPCRSGPSRGARCLERRKRTTCGSTTAYCRA